MAEKVKEPYRQLSREDLLQKVYDLGVAYETYSHSCSQSTVAALYRVVDLPEALVKASCSNAGGTALQMVGTCGGLVGGIMVLDYFFGRPFEHMSDNELIQDPNVSDLFQRQLYGRFFYLEDEEEFKKMDEAGGHSNPEKCPRIVGNASRWTMEILLDNGAVTLV